MENSNNPTERKCTPLSTIEEAAFNYHKGDFKAFKMWVETHKRDHGRFTLNDAYQVREEVKRCIMEEHKTMLAALDFQFDGIVDKYEAFEMTSS
jgi:SPX domain protein involved in polyphosphate accumulation